MSTKTTTDDVIDYTSTVIDSATSDGHPETEAATATPEQVETVGQDGQPDEGDEPGSGNREAAKYRRRLRDVEAERDSLRGQVEALQRAKVEEIARAKGHLSSPAGLWASGTDLASLVAEDGTVNERSVLAACETAAESLGLVRTQPGRVPTQGTGSSRVTPDAHGLMASAIAGRR